MTESLLREAQMLCDTITAHEIESLSCDSDDNRYCECLREAAVKLKVAISAHLSAESEAQTTNAATPEEFLSGGASLNSHSQDVAAPTQPPAGDTPRSDAAEYDTGLRTGDFAGHDKDMVVSADFARTLERELAAAKSERESLIDAINSTQATKQKMWEAMTSAEQSLAALQSRLDSVELPDAVNEPQEVLMGMSLLQYAHDMRMRACSAWSDARDTKGETNQASCDEAAAFERRLKSAINEMAEAYDTLRQHCAALSVKCAGLEKDARAARRRGNLLVGMNLLSEDEIDKWQEALTKAQSDGDVVFPPGSNVLIRMALATAIDAAIAQGEKA